MYPDIKCKGNIDEPLKKDIMKKTVFEGQKRPVVIIVMDGVGYTPSRVGNAVAASMCGCVLDGTDQRVKRKDRPKVKLSELRKFLDLETSTVSGARRVSKSRIAQLQSKGYTFIKTEKDLRKFGEFMDYNRALKKGGLYDSERVIEMMDKVDQRGINVDQVKKDFDWWMENYELLDDVPDMIGSRSAGLWKQALEAFLEGLT